jgi:hypothetical protein
MYCAGYGLAVPTGTCAAGWYCSGGAYSDKPTTYVNSSSSIDCPIYSLNETGGVCLPGKLIKLLNSGNLNIIIKNMYKLE